MRGVTFNSFSQNFLGHAPDWYKLTIIAFLAISPLLLAVAGPTITGWVVVLQFIFTLAMALKCYPLQPGGLIAFEAIILGLTNPYTVYHEAEANFAVILLLIFMVAGIFFLKEMLLARVFGHDPVQPVLELQYLAGMYVDIGRLALKTGARLMHHNP